MLQQPGNTTFRTVFSLAVFVLTAAGLKAGPIAYATLQTTSADTFGTLDLATGVFTPINNAEPSQLNLALFGGNLYALEEGGSVLYQVNPANGNLTTLGSSFEAFILGSTTGGLYDVSDGLVLNSVDPSNGDETTIGSTGTPGFENWYTLSNGGSALYMGVENTLYSVNVSTGAATPIGTNYGTPVAGEGLAEMGALVFENGVLYGAQEGEWIDTIDTSTGLATNVSTLQGAFAGSFIYGLAPDVAASGTPEPATMLLLCIGLVALCAGKLKRKAYNAAN